MKKSLKKVLFVLLIPCMLSIASCDQNDPDDISTSFISNKEVLKEVTGRYVSSNISNGSREDYYFEIKETGEFSFGQIEYEGIITKESSIIGYLTIDENKVITSVSLEDISNISGDKKNTFLGNTIEITSSSYVNSISASLQMEYIKNIYAEILKNCFKIIDNYMVFINGDDVTVLYKENSKKLDAGEKVLFMTQKERNDVLRASSLFVSRNYSKYEYDMYFMQNENYDETNKQDVTDLMEEISNYCYLIVSGKNGELIYPEFDSIITNVENVDIKTLNTGTAKVSYELGDKQYTEEVTYKVISSEDEHPDNSIIYLSSIDDDIIPLEKGTDILTLEWRLSYKTYNSNYNYIYIDEENCTGENAVISITGYDATKSGYQVITFTYRGMTSKQSIFVYDETVNPLTKVVTTGNVYKKTVDGVDSFDFSNVSFTLTYLNGTSETKTYDEVKDNITIVSELTIDKYENNDDVSIKYTYIFEGKEYDFYRVITYKTSSETTSE